MPSLPCPPDRVDEFIAQPTPEVAAELEQAAGPILVLGAGGKMGLHLALMAQRALQGSKQPKQVIAVSRFATLRGREEFEQLGVATLSCDLEKPEELARLPAAATVFFLAGVKFGTQNSPDLLRRLNIEMPGRVAEHFKGSRIVAFSTGAVYPWMPVESGGATEETPPNPLGDYAASCLGREQAFAEASRRNGTPVALIRLNYAVEFRYGVLLDIASKVWREEPIELAMGHLNLIWQGDAVAHIIRSLALAGSPAVPINITGPGTHSVRDLAIRFGKVLGKVPRLTGTEAPTALLGNASRALRRFGPPRVSLDQLIEWTAAWVQAGGSSWGKPTGFEKRDGNY